MADGCLEKGDHTLESFSESVFKDYKYGDQGRLIHNNERVPVNASALTDLPGGYVDGKINIYFSEHSFSSKWTLFMDMGHEYVHVANYIEQGSKFIYAFSEYAAYTWNGLVTGNVDNSIKTYQKTKWSTGYVDSNKNWIKGFNPNKNAVDLGTLNKTVRPDYMRYGTYGLSPYYPKSLWSY